jgi:hypothetical protein
VLGERRGDRGRQRRRHRVADLAGDAGHRLLLGEDEVVGEAHAAGRLA